MFLGRTADSGSWQGTYNMNLEYFVGPESKEALEREDERKRGGHGKKDNLLCRT